MTSSKRSITALTFALSNSNSGRDTCDVLSRNNLISERTCW